MMLSLYVVDPGFDHYVDDDGDTGFHRDQNKDRISGQSRKKMFEGEYYQIFMFRLLMMRLLRIDFSSFERNWIQFKNQNDALIDAVFRRINQNMNIGDFHRVHSLLIIIVVLFLMRNY